MTTTPPSEHDDYVVKADNGPASVIERIASEWRALAAEGPCDEPFFDPSWVVAYLESFDGGSPVTLITVRRGGALRGVLPLVERSIGFGPIGLRTVRSAANSHFPRFDAVHGAGDCEAVAAAIWEHMQTKMQWDLLRFESTPEEGVVSRLLDLAAASDHATRRHQPGASPYIDLTAYPDDIDEIIATLPIKARSNHRRSLKRLRARGEVTFRVISADDTQEARDEAVRLLCRLEASGWKGQAGTAILSTPETEAFYRQTVSNAVESESLALTQLWCGEDLVASTLNLVWNGTMYELKVGHDESYRECAPGNLLKVWSVKAAREMGLSVFDNCGRSDPHKLVWTSHTRPFAACFIGNRTLRGRVAWALVFDVGLRVRDRLGRVPLSGIGRRLLQ